MWTAPFPQVAVWLKFSLRYAVHPEYQPASTELAKHASSSRAARAEGRCVTRCARTMVLGLEVQLVISALLNIAVSASRMHVTLSH